MRLILFFVSLFVGLSAWAGGESLLDQEATLPEFGTIKYRAPIVEGDSIPLVLFHGIYGGASHRTWRNILPLLDDAGLRVYLMDLPGAGESDKPKVKYTIETVDRFVESFLENVVKERSIAVSESLLSASVMKVSGERPDLIHRNILLSPSGLKSLNEPPSVRQQELFDRLYNNEGASTGFYSQLLTDNSLRYYLSFGFFDDSLINETLLDDFRVLRPNIDQKYISIAFVGGQIWRPFEESAKNVFKPTLVMFG
ncbi:MAG: alpha/beta fold hydrolase, partial [Pseudomonadota bacterium]